MSKPGPLATNTGRRWYATHDGADYAYEACECNYTGSERSSSYPASSGMPVTGQPGITVPIDGWVPGDPCKACAEWGDER